MVKPAMKIVDHWFVLTLIRIHYCCVMMGRLSNFMCSATTDTELLLVFGILFTCKFPLSN